MVFRNDLRKVALAGGGGSLVFAAADAVKDARDCGGCDEDPGAGGSAKAVLRVFGPRRVEGSFRGTSSVRENVGSVGMA